MTSYPIRITGRIMPILRACALILALWTPWLSLDVYGSATGLKSTNEDRADAGFERFLRSDERPTCARDGSPFELQKWLGDLQNGTWIPFSMDIGRRAGEFKIVGARDSSEGGRRRNIVVYEAVHHALLVYLTCELDPVHNLTQLTIKIRAEKNLVGSIDHIEIMDILLPRANGQPPPQLYGLTGGFCEPTKEFPPDSFKPWIRNVEASQSLDIDSDLTGLSSNSQLPLWVLAQGTGGIWFGPAWSGCWNMQIRPDEKGFRVKIGLPTFDFTLFQGEELDLPSAVLGTYSGRAEDGLNAMRRALREYFSPPIDGKKPLPPVLFQGLGALPQWQDGTALYQEAERAAQMGCEAFVLDASWDVSPEVSKWWLNLGHWEPHPGRFPKGITHFADYLHSRGMRFGLWVEPRMNIDKPEYIQKKDLFLIPHPVDPQWNEVLLDFGKEKAQEWFLSLLERFIVEYRADWIWFDFNTEPRSNYWNHYEEANRKGLMELRFYQGLYRVFDIIHEKYPQVWLESCASGGRTIDLGQLMRFHSVWSNDCALGDDYTRNLRSGANRFLPAAYLQNAFFIGPFRDIWRGPQKTIDLGNPHRFLTYFGGPLQFGEGLDRYWTEGAIRDAAHYVALYKTYRHYLNEDFYPLFPVPQTEDAWDGWQYHDPRTNSGILLLFRLKQSREKERVIKLQGSRDDRRFAFSVVAGEAKIEETRQGLNVSLDSNKAVMVHYEPKK